MNYDEISKAEAGLYTYVSEPAQKLSLLLLREATTAIWSTDAPRVIQDYTDHGLQHCVRVAEYACKIIASSNVALTSTEAYLLIASIYLHDIGMQCDVVRWPNIATRSIEFGAQFDVEFSATSANSFNSEEQKAIRLNHNYLSVAWFDIARSEKTTVLANAALGVPTHLIQDVLDVCLHHTKLPITNCSTSLRRGGEGRKQLVAAILRFSDELDIAATRVKISTVQNFSISPANSLYWFLHNATTISFSTPNAILITVTLHPDDLPKNRSLVHDKIINAFQTKNLAVLDVLKQNAIPIVIDNASEVVADAYADRLPPEIVLSLGDLSKRPSAFPALAEAVSTWLKAIRFEVSEPKQIDEHTIDLEAVLEQGAVRQRVKVRCINGEISKQDVIAVDSTLDRRVPQAWIVSQSRVSPFAVTAAADKYSDSVRVFTLPEFLKAMVWGPYVASLSSLIHRDQISNGSDLYVDLGCYKVEFQDTEDDERRAIHSSLDVYIDEWLKEDGKRHISLLGEFGTGKTWFCRHYTYRQLERYFANPLVERFPLLITLRAFAKAMTAQQLINDALLVQYQLQFVGNAYDTFQELNRNGKLLLILDGFDEMARQVDQQTVIDNFWELASLVTDGSKVILTSRTEYFRQSKESESILGGLEFGRKTLKLDPPKFEVVHLEQLNDAQIRDIIIKRVSQTATEEEAATTASKILSVSNLAEMARKPVLIELLLAALADVSPDVLKKPAQVYLYATNKLLLRNIETERTFTTTADKIFFLCELASEMIYSGDLRVHYKDLPSRIAQYFKIEDKQELDHWDFDLRNQTLLHRNSGHFEFAHKSLAEYFVALKLAAEIGCLPTMFSETYKEAQGVACKFPVSKKVNFDDLAASLGRTSLWWGSMTAVRELLTEILWMERTQAVQLLFDIIKRTKKNRTSGGAIAGGNAIALLSSLGADFRGKDFSFMCIQTCSFAGLDFSETNFSNAQLLDCYFTDKTVLRDCKFHATRFVHPQVRSSVDSKHSNFKKAHFVDTFGLDRDTRDFFEIGGALVIQNRVRPN